MINSPVPILFISRSENLTFNEEILKLAGKPFVVIDFIENGWLWDGKGADAETLVVRQNTAQFGDVCKNGWERLDEFLAQNKPLKYFKRELLKKDASDWLLPIEYPNWNNSVHVEQKAEFNARPIDVLYFWGKSHEGRVQLHGEIWKNSSKSGYAVCDNLYYFNEFMKEEKGRKWVSLWIPHYGRVEIQNILSINGMSKLSVSMPGAGIKCFRSTCESPVNSVMVMQKNDLAWTYNWDDSNCILVEPGKEIQGIEEALQDEHLYEVYLEGVKIAEKYRVDNYIKEYLLKKINEVL